MAETPLGFAQINGREAVPVRAIPLLTDWHTITPDGLAQALAGNEHFFHFDAIRAYQCGGGEPLPKRWWRASRIERAQHLQAMPYERSAQRVDQANGCKPKTMLTRMGEITFEVPQVRTAGFYPSALERGSRSEQSVNLALAEMYVQGVSTRKVIEVLQKLVGPAVSVSSTQISRCAQKLDEGLEA